MRCSVIYKYKHVSITYGASPAWANLDVPSTLSYPAQYWLGDSQNGGFAYQSTNGGSLTFSTPPDFLGGTLDCFFFTGNGDQGAVWIVAVAGATTVSTTSAIDTRAQQAVTMNDAVGKTSSKHLGCVYRIKNLNAGVNTVTLTAATVSGYGGFMGWGIEAPIPPQQILMPDPRAYDYSAYTTATNTGYGPRTMAGAKTATVSAGAGTAGGSVTLGSAVTLATAGTIAPGSAQPGDTITIGTGATQETRRIVAFASTTTCSVDANFVYAHTGEAVKIGLQDADLVGGGYANTADTQGATSVPGVMAAIQSVASEFDSFVKVSNIDSYLNAPGRGQQTVSRLNFAPDGLHYNDQGATLIAAGVSKLIYSMPWSIDQISAPTVPNKRTYLGVYGDSGATPTTAQVVQFSNGWTNLFIADPQYPRTGYYKDMRTREVYVRLAVYNGNSLSVIFTLPVGYRPSGTIGFPVLTSIGQGVVEITSAGSVILTSGNPGPTGIVTAYFSFLAEA
jgi:Mrp family chromosome partitioning ATPase